MNGLIVNLLLNTNALEVNVMSTVAIESNMLNGLFDNQKKLDELFDSIFDDDNYFISSSSTSSSSQSGSRHSAYEVESQYSVKKSPLAIKQNPISYVLPIVLEIAAIYWIVTNLL